MKFSINSQEENQITFNTLKVKINKYKKRGRDMSKKNIVLTSDTRRMLAKMGVQIKNARLRRNISVEEITNKSGVSETTYYAIEKGKDTVSIGAYAAVLSVLELDKDIGLIATDEEGKKKFQENTLFRGERATCKARSQQMSQI